MNTDAPRTPHHYLYKYNINYNTRQNKIGKGKYLAYKEKNLLSENNSYKKVMVCPHVNLNHHTSNICHIDHLVRACSSQRIRHKFVTLIYYKPFK